MPHNPDLISARQNVYASVGLNVLKYQQLELRLKDLLGWHQGTYTPESFEKEMESRLQSRERSTLGLLAGEVFNKVILPTPEERSADGLKEGESGHRFGVSVSLEIHEHWRSRLKALVEQRNHLVHGSLLDWDLDTPEGCQTILIQLDEQRGRIQTELKQLETFSDSIQKCLQVSIP